jgi:transcriptional regulator with XRE-family HTH domain
VVRPLDPYRVVRWVGGRVAERRESINLTQEALAERLDVSVKYLQRVEAGKQNLTIKSIVTLANILDVEPSYLLRAPRQPIRRKPGRPPKRRAK